MSTFGQTNHGSAGLIAAMRGCPWAYDTEPDTTAANLRGTPHPYAADQRPACGKWKAGDAVLAPWFRKSGGLLMLYERTGGLRAGELAHALLPEPRRRIARDHGFDLLEALRQHPDLADVDLGEGEGFKVLESREVWRYVDPKPGIEAIDCKPCLRTILEVQGARADYLAERASKIATAEFERCMNLDRGICPVCGGDTRDHGSESLRVCRPCGFEWKRVPGGWDLLNATNRGTHAHT